MLVKDRVKTKALAALTLTLYILGAEGATPTKSEDADFDLDYSEDHATDHEFASTCLRLCYCYRKPLTPRSSAIIARCHGLSDLPSATPKHTTSLVLRDSNIGQITDASFQREGLKFLKNLECSGCQITAISLKAFRPVKKLKTINFSNNSITDLGPDHFTAQKSLTVLNVSLNPGLDCHQLEKGLPKTLVLCDVDTNTEQIVEEIVTVPTADNSLEDKVGETESLPQEDTDYTSSFASTVGPDDGQNESHSWLTVTLISGLVTTVVGVLLAIVFRRQIVDACQGVPGWLGQKWRVVRNYGKVDMHERGVGGETDVG